MTAILVDDEKYCRDFLALLLQRHCPQIQVLALCANAQEGLRAVKMYDPELIFLDIEMPDMSGFDFLDACGDRKMKVIFSSGHCEYAIKAFRRNALDYASDDIVSRGIISPPEFMERLTQLNFHMDEMTSLRIGETEINPVLASMENTGGLTSHRNIYIVFENSGTVISKSDSLAFVFRDDLFGTGMSYFPFAGQTMYGKK